MIEWVPESDTVVINKMTIHNELEKQGFEFSDEYGCSENRAEVWINKEPQMGVRIEWFRLD